MGRQWGIAKRTEYGGRLFASKLEARLAANLDLWKKTKGPDRVVEWEAQVAIPIVVNGVKICRYIVDFKVTRGDGRVEYLECKGHETAVWKLKWKLAQALYPDREFRVVK